MAPKKQPEIDFSAGRISAPDASGLVYLQGSDRAPVSGADGRPLAMTEAEALHRCHCGEYGAECSFDSTAADKCVSPTGEG